MKFLLTLAGVILWGLLSLAWLRWHYVTERWPIDIGWRRLDDLKEHEPGRLWTVHRINRRAGTIVLIGLRRPQ